MLPRVRTLLPRVNGTCIRELAIDPAAEVEERPLGRNCRRTLAYDMADREMNPSKTCLKMNHRITAHYPRDARKTVER